MDKERKTITETGKGGFRKRNIRRRLLAAVFLLMIFVCALTGCGRLQRLRESRVVLTTAPGEDEVFRIGRLSCTLPEAMVYLINLQNAYKNSLGGEVLSLQTPDGTVADRIKEAALAQITQVKVMNLLAEQNGVVLDEAERQKAADAARAYYGTLNSAEKQAMRNITEETVRELYEEYALADKVYRDMISDINPEISDDEARTVTVEQIFIRRDATADADDRIREIRRQLENGESFEKLAAEYNEAKEDTVSIARGEAEPAYEEAAFGLGTDEVSGVVVTEEGYYLLKCISTFDRAQTRANKEKIIEERRREAFSAQYDVFAETLPRQMNSALWEDVALPDDPEITTADFFTIYEANFAA